WYELLRQGLPDPPDRLTGFDREVILAAAAHEAEAAGTPAPFSLRPGLIAAMLDFYDQIRRRQETIEAFERVLSDELEQAGEDRGAERLLRQTRFLAAAYRRYEARVRESGRVDEPLLRERLIATPATDPLRRVVVTTSDWIGEMPGLSKADFDLLTRLPGLEQIDVLATSEVLASGFHERVKEWLPDLDEVEGRHLCEWREAPLPTLLVPEPDEAAPRAPVFTFAGRDREEELKSIARRIKGLWRAATAGDRAPLDRTAIVFQRPLPYIYLARGVFGDARIPYQTLDALPLAAEPYAAAVDLVFTFVDAAFTRDSLVALLSSPHFRFEHGGRAIGRAGIAALDEALSERRFLGGLEELEKLRATWETPAPVAGRGGEDRALDALDAAIEAARALEPLRSADRASLLLRRIIAFLTAHDRPSFGEEPLVERRLRARAAIIAALDALARACEEYGDQITTLDVLTATIRRWVESQTFTPADGGEGLHLIDAQAARYADLDDLHVVGLVEGEWPARPPRNIFYPLSLLGRMRWPSEQDRLGASRAAFFDLIRLPRRTTAASFFRLEDDAIVEPSALVEELTESGLSITIAPDAAPARIFTDEALAESPAEPEAAQGVAAEWLALRRSRAGFEDARFHGRADEQPQRPYSMSRVDLYRRCPFQYFAQNVLKLKEEPDDDDALGPRAQGDTLHELLRAFHARWDDRGQPMTPEALDEARALFAEVAEEHLAGLPEADATILRERLLGSAAHGGAADGVLRLELTHETNLKRRLLEHPFEGRFAFTDGDRTREVPLRGQIDRIDLLSDGTFRLFDYKLGRPPGRHALQLPIYALCAEQWLSKEPDGPWALGEAAYVALRDRQIGGKPLKRGRKEGDRQLAEAQAHLIDAVEGIERGEFPPRPAELRFCRFCAYVSVCRKDYVNPNDREGDDGLE
ncbi:MAG TPA: PD-(D/E)XK nuclease family protein, partial [Vicinamibacterales bacterium]|nr:PD-(D/E)XK nuclease family protein [Vicinamibacterales bacterium]